jgi:ribosome-associated protein
MLKNTEELKNFITQCLEDKKSEDITVTYCSSKSNLAEIMIVATGRSLKNISAIADYISLELKYKKNISVNIEGLNISEWILIDVGDIIVHLFTPDARQHFRLEEIWRS